MAFFAGVNKQSNGDEADVTTVIASNTKFKGEINTDCHLTIDGEFEGTIRSKNTVMIGKTGVIIGDIFAQKVIVSGKVVSNIEAEIVEIMPGGRLEGMITVDELVVERKGIFLGQSRNAQKDDIKLLSGAAKIEPMKSKSKDIE